MLYRLYRVETIDKALCFYIESYREIDQKKEMPILMQILQAVQKKKIKHSDYIEVGPKLNFTTPWCSNTVQLLHNSGFNFISRVEKSYLYRKGFEYPFDPILETIYPKDGLNSLDIGKKIKESKNMNINKIGKYSKKNGLTFDKDDIKYYKNLFKKLGRHPTDVELFDLAQSNSEHSRHWFFNGRLIDVDGVEIKESLFDLVKEPLKRKKDNSIVAFCDNASAIKGYLIKWIKPINPIEISPYQKVDIRMHPTYTAETHNFPTGISPFSGAATGTGGRIRDNQSIGRGGLVIASVVGYCVGNLGLDDFECDWEDTPKGLNNRMATAEKIEIEASNGASDYGNKFGEPIILGFTRSFGQWMIRMDTGVKERVEWIKPIMFSGGIGQTIDCCITKLKSNEGNHIVRIGGPAYRIGIGGGSASSRADISDTDIAAVQRGDPEMENKLNRVIRACVELQKHNPIISIHDQGAGGMGNVTKEIVAENETAGAIVDLDLVVSGDPSLSAKELWVSEHQEQDTVLVNDEGLEVLKKLGERERVSVVSVGKINKSGNIIVKKKDKVVVNLPLSDILGRLPRKVYHMKKVWYKLNDNKLCVDFKIKQLLEEIEKVFSVLSVGSKRFLVNKVDRSVTGMIAQQQCVGMCQVPISNYSLVAQSYFGYTGIVTSIGEQPIKGLICPEVMSRLCVGEMLCNMMGCVISKFEDIKCSSNWMWPLEFEGEKYRMYSAVKSLSEILCKLGIAIDGGKDSLSMSHGDIKSPGSLVLSGYCTVPDIRMKVDPGLKKNGNSLFLIDFSGWKCRMGGSAYLQSKGELGKFVPDLDNVELLKKVFLLVQKLITKKIILSLHDRSDGGLITTLCEMVFANQLGVRLDLIKYSKKCGESISINDLLFNEELGVVIEVESAGKLINIFKKFGLSNCLVHLGYVSDKSIVDIRIDNKILINENISSLQMFWELLSFNLEKRQTTLECARDEYSTLGIRKMKDWNGEIIHHPIAEKRIQIAVIREEGCNGDRELSAMFYHAGFRPWDVCMSDLLKEGVKESVLDQFRGIVFPGGFSYADVCGSGRGWASIVLYNEKVKRIFNRFKERKDSFSLGVCNGFQLMCNIDWIPGKVRLVENQSKRFESRCLMVKVCNDNSILFKGMSGEILNVWISHHEGQINVPINNESLIVLKYVDHNGKETEKYPWNPNGSIGGVTGICDETGRHFGLMPHLERSFLSWQMPYGSGEGNYTGWFKCVLNAYNWCIRE